MIGKRLKSARSNKGWTQTELAKRVGTSQGYIAQIEGNDREPSIDVLRNLADVLDTSVGWLTGDTVQDMTGAYILDPRAALVEDQAASPGLRDLAQDVDLCASLDVRTWEWGALRSLAVPVPPTKDGYLLLLFAIRASCPR